LSSCKKIGRREQLNKPAALKYASHEMSGDAPPAATVGPGRPDMVRHLWVRIRLAD
jgi:hypothetical protein